MKKTKAHRAHHLKTLAGHLSRASPQFLCLISCTLLFLLLTRFSMPETELRAGRALPRPDYGGRETEYALTVEGLSDQPISVNIPVAPRRFLPEEAEKIFASCMDLLSVSILADNASLSEITSDLSLQSSVPRCGVRAVWISDRPELVSSSGAVRNQGLTDPEEVTLSVHLTDPSGQYSADYLLPVTVLPEALSGEEQLLRDYLAFLRTEDQAQGADPEFLLPEEYGSLRLSYTQPAKNPYLILLLLGPALALLLSLRTRQNRQSAEAARRREMLLDYPEIVSKLMVFIGAGMTIRLAWGSIVRDYETGGGPKRFAYEEMAKADARLRTGANEGLVYHDFGRSCGLRQYMKLSGLLEQNRKSGVANLRMILGAEMDRAWEERKTEARRLGEEAGTRLLLPLFLMLIIVMIMIIAPALLSF